MRQPLFDIDIPGMQVTLNSFVPGKGLAWAQLFPLRYTPKFDLKGIEGDEGIPVSADKVAFDAKAPIKTRKKVGSWSGTLGKIAVSRVKNEMDINDYLDMQAASAANADPQAARYLVDLVYNDIDFCSKAMDYRVEVDAMRIASAGKQVLSESIDGDLTTQETLDFNIPAENFGGVAKKWSKATEADGIKDIVTAANNLKKRGGKAPRYAFMEQAAFDALCGQAATAKRLFPRLDQTMVTADLISLQGINSYLQSKGWPVIVVVDTYATIEDKSGKQTVIKPFNEKAVVLSPEPRLGYTYYKTVPVVQNSPALQQHGAYYKVSRYSELNPMQEVTMSEAYVQCALTNRASLLYLNVDNETGWNEGK